MVKLRNMVVVAGALGCVVVALSARHRRLVAEKLAAARAFISRRVIDRDDAAATREARWEGEGGAMRAPRDAAPPTP